MTIWIGGSGWQLKDWLTVLEAVEKLCCSIWILTNGGLNSSGADDGARSAWEAAAIIEALSVLILGGFGTLRGGRRELRGAETFSIYLGEFQHCKQVAGTSPGTFCRRQGQTKRS